MLLRFRVANFASLRDEQELSLIALDEHPDLATRPVPAADDAVLPVVAIFGANASGKSNVLHALNFMRGAVVNSHQRWKPDARIPRTPFLLDRESRNLPSRFIVDFVAEGVRYEYGFALDDDRVVEEWLFAFPERRPRLLYRRTADAPIKFGASLRGHRKLVADIVRPNSLYLSAAAANNHPQLTPVYSWFQRGCRVALESNAFGRLGETIHHLEHHDRESLVSLLRFADLGVVDVAVERRELSPDIRERVVQAVRALNPEASPEQSLPELSELETRLFLVHRAGEHAERLPLEYESSGTRTWLELLGPMWSTLRRGTVLAVDELDARLHPSLMAHLVRMFQNPETNPRGAQLVFDTHDVTLLSRSSPAGLHRDQIWFTEKDHEGATRLFPLTDYRVREQLEDVPGRYLKGRYGAVPILDEDLLTDLVRR